MSVMHVYRLIKIYKINLREVHKKLLLSLTGSNTSNFYVFSCFYLAIYFDFYNKHLLCHFIILPKCFLNPKC